MNDRELRRIKREISTGKSHTPRYKRKSKLKMRHGHRLDAELARTSEKMWLLCELICEARNPRR